MNIKKQNQVIDQIIECAVLWISADADNPETLPKEWQAVLPLLRTAPRLQAAAANVLSNLADGNALGPNEVDVDVEDYPRDDDGNLWWHDLWELNCALSCS